MQKVTIYTRAFCPFCTRAVSLLKQKGVDFKEIALQEEGVPAAPLPPAFVPPRQDDKSKLN